MANGQALDGFEAYYTEKLWHLIPEVYRTEDGLGVNPGVLRQLIEAIAEQAAITRRSIDRLWEDQHIETCDQWAVPYIGDLVGIQPASVLDDEPGRSLRGEVAIAVNLRRRRGTPEAMETLLRLTTGWDVVIVEMFRRLVRARHRLDPAPVPTVRFTGTPPGGTADLRRPVGAELALQVFDEYARTPDFRQLSGEDGAVGARKINIHLFRIRTFTITESDPVQLVVPAGFPRTFTIDPSGRDIQLFHNGRQQAVLQITPGEPQCRMPFEWEVDLPIRCRLLGNEEFVITAGDVITLSELGTPPTASELAVLEDLIGVRFQSERALRRQLLARGVTLGSAAPDWYIELLGITITPDSGKAAIYGSSLLLNVETAAFPDAFSRQRVAAADLSHADCHPIVDGFVIKGLVDPLNGRFATAPSEETIIGAPLVERYLYGFPEDIGAGPYTRLEAPEPGSNPPAPPVSALIDGTTTFDDNHTYQLAVSALALIDETEIFASNGKRPYIRLTEDNTDPDGNPGAVFKPDSDKEATLLIDGGWFGSAGMGDDVPAGQPADVVFEPATGGDAALFDWARITIKRATLDPGGVRADGIRILPLRIVVRSQVKELVIEQSIVGPIEAAFEDDEPIGRIERLVIRDSIVDAQQIESGIAISNRFGDVVMDRVTVFGDVQALRLEASHVIVMGGVTVINHQDGCFRFSAASPRPDTRLPPRYRDFTSAEIEPLFFTSTRFGDPGYAELSVVAPEALTRGGSEMGVFAIVSNADRLDSARTRVVEFGAVGVQPQYLFEGDEGARHIGELGARPEPPDPPPGDPPDPGDTLPPGPGEPDPDPPQPPTIPPEPPEPPEPPVVPGLELLVLGPEDADLNGAPEYWRDLGWRPAPGSDQPSSGSIPSVPLDKCDFVLEYDARFGTEPDHASQGWTAVNVSASEYVIESGGALKTEIASNDDGHFKKSVTTPAGRPASIHGYAVYMVDETSSGANEGEGLDLLVQASTGSLAKFKGLRAAFGNPLSGRRLQLIELDGGGDEDFATTRPLANMTSVWHKVSLEGHFATGRGLESIDDRVSNKDLAFFGDSDASGPSTATFEAKFGVTDSDLGGPTKGRYRNVVASAPGRFIRAWFRAVAVTNAPKLRLVLAADFSTTPGTARILVRYQAMAENADPFSIPGTVLEQSPNFTSDQNEFVVVEFTLSGLVAGNPFWFTVERNFAHAEDIHRGTVHLLEAVIVPTP